MRFSWVVTSALQINFSNIRNIAIVFSMAEYQKSKILVKHWNLVLVTNLVV